MVTSVKVSDTVIEDPTEMANKFNNFFVNVASKIKEPVINTNHDKLREFRHKKCPEGTKFVILSIQKEKVSKFLSNIDINKATGTGMIGPRLLKLAAPLIADEITFICNHSITNSVFPSKWKEAKVAPLYKKRVHMKMLIITIQSQFYLSYQKYLKKHIHESLSNFLLHYKLLHKTQSGFRAQHSCETVLSKVLEKHVHESLSNFLHHYKLLHKTQSGFRAQHSCESAFVNMRDLWLNAIDKSKMVGVVLVAFKKAFDLVDHQILINKLEIYGLKDDALIGLILT